MTITLGTRRSHAIALSSLLLALSPLALPAAPAAQAATGAMHHCTTDEINNGKVMRQIRLKHKRFGLTHARIKLIPAGVSFSQKVTLKKIDMLEASLKASASIKSEAGAWFAKASVEASVEVAGRYQHTSETSITETYTIPKASHDRSFAFFDGHESFTFGAHRRTCSRAGERDSYGTLKSFGLVDVSGAVRCPHSRYRSGTLKYTIALHSGC